MSEIKILLTDDHQIIRDGIKAMLNSNPDMNVVSEASNGREAVEKAEQNDFDVILMDINMPDVNGIDATDIITKRNEDTKIIALTMHNEEAYIAKMLQAGAKGYVLKDSGMEELQNAIKTVMEGEKYFSNEVSVTLINSMLKGGTVDSLSSGEKKEKGMLTSREEEILKQIANGNTNMEIAEELHISNRTVDTHRRNILQKLKVRNTAELIKYAIKNGLIE